MFHYEPASPLLSALLSQMENNNNIPVVEFDFMVNSREGGQRVRAVRRLSNTLIPNEILPANVFLNPHNARVLANRPRLHRQNAMPAPPRPVAKLTPPPDYTHTLRIVKPPLDFECSICLEDASAGEIAIHPCNCHTFHKACLESELKVKKNCPMGRRLFNY